MNWTGQAIVCPRARIGELAKWDEARRPGIYFLVGDEQSESRQLVYVGEAENVFARLQSHVKNKEFWSRVVLFTSKDENLTKAHAKYLEARIVQLAHEADRVRLENGNAPQSPVLPRADRDAMEDFLGPLSVLLGALGLPILQAVAFQPEPEEPAGEICPAPLSRHHLEFQRSKDRIDAKGVLTDEGFVVYEGSLGNGDVRDHLGKGVRAYRDQLIADGSIREENGVIRFMRNVLFTSPSAAAAVLAGGSINGREAWKDQCGTTLKALEEELAGDSVEEEVEPER